MIRPFTRWNGFCYLQAGLVGLAVDCALFLLALSGGFTPGISAALGYIAGASLHGLICNRGVFESPAATVSQLRGRQQYMFTLAAILGLGVTVGSVMALIAIGVAPLLAKLAAIVASFGASFLIRRRMLLAA